METITQLAQWERFCKRLFLLRLPTDLDKTPVPGVEVDCYSMTAQSRKGRFLCQVERRHFDALLNAGFLYDINNRPFNKFIDYAVNAGFWDAVQKASAEVDIVNNAPHYGGKDNPYEVVKVLEAWKLDNNAYLWNTVKYIARHNEKGNPLQDLKKAQYYLNREIANREKGQSANG